MMKNCFTCCYRIDLGGGFKVYTQYKDTLGRTIKWVFYDETDSTIKDADAVLSAQLDALDLSTQEVVDCANQTLFQSTDINKVAWFEGDIKVTGTIDPQRLLFQTGGTSPTYDAAGLGKFAIEWLDSLDLEFKSATTPNLLYLQDAGNVGIGTSTPDAKLDVFGGDALIHGVTVGRGSGNSITNTVVGSGAFSNNTSGTLNTVIGSSALRFNQTGGQNIGIGASSLFGNTTGSQNVGVGSNTLRLNVSGGQNVALGVNAGRYIADGSTGLTSTSQSIFLGTQTKSLIDGSINEIVIGYNTTGLGSNTVILGNDFIEKTSLKGNVGIGNNNPNSVLDVTSVSSGILIPRLTTLERDAIVLPTVSELLFNTDTGVYEYWDGAAWQPFVTGTGGKFVDGDNPLDAVYTTGDVGIGVTNPLSRLHVNELGIGGWRGRIVAGGDTYSFLMGQYSGTANGNVPQAWLGAHNSTLTQWAPFYINPDGNEDLYLGKGNIVTVRNLNGNVGIGITSPTAKLEVNGLTKIQNNSIGSLIGINAIGFNRNVVSGGIYDASVSAYQITARDERFSFEGWNGAANPLLDVLKNGNVGINTIAPTAKLHVNGNVKIATAPVQTSTTGKTFLLRDDATQEVQSITAANFLGESAWSLEGNAGTTPINFLGTTDLMPLRIRTNNIERMIVTDAGNVGIGTSTPTANLHILDNANSPFGYSFLRVEKNGGFMAVTEGTAVANAFLPFLIFRSGNRDNVGGGITGELAPANDVSLSSLESALLFTARRTDNTNIQNTNAFLFRNNQTALLTIAADGRTKIATTPTQTTTIGKTILLKDDATDEIQGITAANFLGESAWTLEGNAGTTPINFLGTTDAMPLRIRTNNIERMIVSDAGNVGIGTTNPTSKLTVDGGAGSGFVSNIFGSRPNNGFIAKFQNTGNNANGVVIDISSGFLNGKELLRFTDRDVFLASIDANAVTNTANGINFKTNNVVDAFSIDNTTFTVDALNNRVGINTDAPATSLHVVGNASITNTPIQTSTIGKTILLKDDATDEVQEINPSDLAITEAVFIQGNYSLSMNTPATQFNSSGWPPVFISTQNITSEGSISVNANNEIVVANSGWYDIEFSGTQQGNLSNSTEGLMTAQIGVNNVRVSQDIRIRHLIGVPNSFTTRWTGFLNANELISFKVQSTSGGSASGLDLPFYTIKVNKI